ncbi:GNAT family N-acetyltransferase [Pedobacter sp. MC2016-24]|uniref:GNAT family N-acetyltransferase n=1 Tax=Pedobacter sp. MC2016-24 TaxID=2780090 RepID=UPI001881C705|nr:GNAT family N-acetyltransferase [Pedobacter sp. MC2016-24]MBE9597727.1 GNAT family N-acetyltransferase [Pedobacter sp. MC2016-24]
MENSYLTTRLVINKLNLADHQFIMQLVNTPEWIKFIGNRNINTAEDAKLYIQKIIDSSDVNYWVVKFKETGTPIGVVTFIKRDYLEYYDIGFAFLSEFGNKGYAFEATSAVLNCMGKSHAHPRILATTIKENINSIKLLKKLGFQFEGEIDNGKNELSLYAVDCSS